MAQKQSEFGPAGPLENADLLGLLRETSPGVYENLLTTVGALLAAAAAGVDGDKGDITVAGDAWSINTGVVGNTELADMPQGFKGRGTAGEGPVEDLTPSDARSLLGAGEANGLAELGPDGKVPSGQLPSAVVGQVEYIGAWDANAGSAPSVSPTKGQYWIVTVAGTTALSGISEWQVGDWAIYNGTSWNKVDNTDAVVSVAGLMGAISAAALKTALALAKADVGLGSVDNTSDANKPVSTPQQAALDAKAQDRRAVTALAIASGVVNVDCALGDYFTLSLTGNVTGITFSNLPGSGKGASLALRIRQDGTGGRTVALPASFKPITGSDTAVQSAANAYTVLMLTTYDNGTRWEYSMKAAAA